MNAIDLARVRAETPSTKHRIHVNNAGASPTPAPVARAVQQHLDLECELGGYAAETAAEAALEDFYDAFGALLNCSRDEIAFVENATRAWDMVFYGIPFEQGDRIITSAGDYGSNHVALLHMAKTRGVVVDVAADEPNGTVSAADIARLIRPTTKLIAITHIPTHSGVVNPVTEIGAIAGSHNVLFLVDACQSLGQYPVDVQSIGCDFLSGTGRKFLRGPRGTGVLYARKAALRNFHPPFIDAHAANWVAPDRYELRDDARRFESYECHVAGKIGLARAVRYALDLGLDAIWERVRSLSRLLREGLANDPRILLTDRGGDTCGIVTFRLRDEDPATTHARLEAAGIQAWQSGIAWSRLDYERRGIEKLVRISPHYFNTEQEIRTVCTAVLAQVRN
jgi:cysteine desulfurase/selenocysteine lyase